MSFPLLFLNEDDNGSPIPPPIENALKDNNGNDLLDNNSVILTDNG